MLGDPNKLLSLLFRHPKVMTKSLAWKSTIYLLSDMLIIQNISLKLLHQYYLGMEMNAFVRLIKVGCVVLTAKVNKNWGIDIYQVGSWLSSLWSSEGRLRTYQLFIKMGQPRPLFHYFRLTKHTLQFLQQINMKNVHPV